MMRIHSRSCFEMEGITHIEDFIEDPEELFRMLINTVNWDERMSARKTASYGQAYNYSQMEYPYQPFLPALALVNKKLIPVIGFEPNNCLVNYYPDGKSKMGYHSDQTDILENSTGIAIVSVGETRVLKFRNIENPDVFASYDLKAGSLIYMTQECSRPGSIRFQSQIPKMAG